MKHSLKQYTIRHIPERLDQALRRKVRESGKSFNQVALEALMEGAGEHSALHDDLDFLIGTMPEKEAEAIDAEVKAQRQIDPELWK